MSAKPKQKNPSAKLDKLERMLDRLAAAERRKFINEDILRLEKNGDLSYESIRTTAIPTRSVSEGLPLPDHHSPTHHALPASHSLPNNLPETPLSQQFGNLSSDMPVDHDTQPGSPPGAELNALLAVTAASTASISTEEPSQGAPINCHEHQISGNQLDSSPVPCPPSSAPSPAANELDPLEDLLRRALAVAHVRRGRPPAFDERSKGQLVALLSVGMSMRQAAALLGVSHTTVQNTLKGDPALADEITAARFQAQLQPLACIIREARRSWKAATWLLKYLDYKIASHEETPDERHARQEREAQEFFARSATPGVKQRRELA